MWDRGELHAMEDDEKMDEDKREPGNEEDEDEEQEEENQKARAIASQDLPSRREGPQLEPHSMSKPVQPLHERERTEEHTHTTHKRRHDGREGEDDRAVTTYSIDYM